MFSFEETLRYEFPQILDILPTHTTTLGNPANQLIGRWDLTCAKLQFNLSTKLKLLYDDHLKSNGTVLVDGPEEVTFVSQLKGKPMTDDETDSMTRDSGKERYNSNWTSRLADFHVEANPQRSTAMSTTQSRPRYFAQSPAKKLLSPGRKPNGKSVNSEPISCHPIDPITPRFPNGPITQLRVAARTENGKSGGPSGSTTESAKGSPRHPCPNTYRAARVLGFPTCSRSAKPPFFTCLGHNAHQVLA
jgi:hypothetical protein